MAHTSRYGYAVSMKTTLDIADSLLARAKRHARKTGRPLRMVVEEGLQRVLDEPRLDAPYRLPDCSVGVAGGSNPLDTLTWPDLRREIYGDRG